MTPESSFLPQWAQALLLVVAIGAAVYERIRASRMGVAQANANAKDDLIKVLKDTADSWKFRYETEHSEAVERREQFRAAEAKFKDDTARLTAENNLLRSKTDVTPIMAALADQSRINEKVVKSLDGIMKWCDAHTPPSTEAA